ncbi:hypothetical protein E0Z10_g6272 [Xylaria hypoxylon]|uniref:Actin-like ATPase domain-containing protein n=1 Tax=Xylaria hypoxylon TaxID=37992 RepID=A0A4Z0YEN7_9PEZI|nr:hypothetical protein E0Z10_g6272 [Xylaria hypoxylon]
MAALETATLGLDFGCFSSKMTLAYKRRPTGRPEIIRVPLAADITHPERLNAPASASSLFEFVASAALEEGRLIPGRLSLDKDESFPLKTIMVHRAISRERTIKGMPGGRRLLHKIATGQITADMEDDALCQHFELLREMATKSEIRKGVSIETVVLTYPNYLCNGEEEDDFDKYSSYYLGLIRPIWMRHKPFIHFEFVSEGQAAALYVCEPFSDDLPSIDPMAFWKPLIEGQIEHHGLNLVVADAGSSTLNIQVQSVYFDINYNVLSSQSNVDAVWSSGVQGGSHMSNSEIRDYVRDTLLAHITQGELAAIMTHFEEVKWRLNYTEPKSLHLMGTTPHITVHLQPHVIRKAFTKAFKKGLQTLVKELNNIRRLKRNFGVVLCGGSYCNPGLKQEVAKLMKKIEICAEAEGVIMRSFFIADKDTMWSTAVSTGAAIAAMNIPSLTRVLTGSAIAIQKATRFPAPEMWRGDPFASVLFRQVGHIAES